MKVLYLLRYYPTVSETFVYREIEAVARAGHEVEILRLGTRPDGTIATELPSVRVTTAPRHPFTRTPDTAGSAWLRRFQRPKDVARLGWLARFAKGFDRIHVHFAGEAAEIACALHQDSGIPFSVMVHGGDLFRPRPAMDEVLAHADAVLAVADHHVAVLRERNIHARRVRCGPDLDRLVPAPPVDAPFHAVAIGRNVAKKGFSDLLEAWPKVAGHLTLVSDWTGPVPDRVTVTGLLPHAEALEWIRRAHLLVLPCKRAPDGDQDGVPVVLMEALALGRPVISTAVSGIPELVDASVGWLVPPDDRGALVAALEEARNPEARNVRGARGPDHLRERGFTLADQVAGVLAAWKALTTESV